MAKAHFVKSAQKDYPDHGIKKGESYYWWAFMQGGRGGAKRYSKTPPRRSQLTQSEFWSAIYDLQDNADHVPHADDLESEIESIKDELRNIQDEIQSKFDNLPENFQNGDSGNRLQERVDALESAISDLESVDVDFSEPDVDKEEDETDEEFEERKEQEIQDAKDQFAQDSWSQVQDVLSGISCE